MSSFAGLNNADKIVKMFGLLEELRKDIKDERGFAIGFMDHSIAADSLQIIYLNFKSFLVNGNDPIEKVGEVYEFSVGEELIEQDDSCFLVIMLKWLELEQLVGELEKKINKLLNSAEEEEKADVEVDVEVEVEVKEEAEDDAEEEVEWIEQYDEASGYSFYFHSKTGASQWEKPECAYIPFSLNSLGYEMVEETSNDVEGEGDGGNADWVWDDLEGRWDYTGQDVAIGGEHTHSVVDTEKEETENDVFAVKKEELVSEIVATTADLDDDEEPIILSLNISGDSPKRKNKKSSKKKKKFIVRPKKADAPQALPFYMAATTTRAQQNVMEEMLLTGLGDNDNDIDNDIDNDSEAKPKSPKKERATKKTSSRVKQQKALENEPIVRVAEAKDCIKEVIVDHQACSTPPPPCESPLPPMGLPPLSSISSFSAKRKLPPLP